MIILVSVLVSVVCDISYGQHPPIINVSWRVKSQHVSSATLIISGVIHAQSSMDDVSVAAVRVNNIQVQGASNKYLGNFSRDQFKYIYIEGKLAGRADNNAECVIDLKWTRSEGPRVFEEVVSGATSFLQKPPTYKSGAVLTGIPATPWEPDRISGGFFQLTQESVLITLKPHSEFAYKGLTYSSQTGAEIEGNRVMSGVVFRETSPVLDVNGDDRINNLDISEVALALYSRQPTSDVDGNGIVTVDDLLLVHNNIYSPVAVSTNAPSSPYNRKLSTTWAELKSQVR